MPADRLPTEAPIAALNAAIRQRSAPELMKADLPAWLRSQGVSGDDLAAMTEVGAERLLVYRMLVHNRMRNTVRDFIPRTAARMGHTCYRGYIDEFVDAQASSTPYLRDVPAEFVEWARPRMLADPEVADYLADLATHELLHLDVRNDPRGGETPTDNAVALDRPLRFDGAVRRIGYDFAVHKLPAGTTDRSEPERTPTQLLVYRDEDGKPRYLDLIPFAAALLDRLVEHGDALQPALAAACELLGEGLDDDKLGQTAVLLADLAERKVMLGAK